MMGASCLAGKALHTTINSAVVNVMMHCWPIAKVAVFAGLLRLRQGLLILRAVGCLLLNALADLLGVSCTMMANPLMLQQKDLQLEPKPTSN